jgi:hypothetical protein
MVLEGRGRLADFGALTARTIKDIAVVIKFIVATVAIVRAVASRDPFPIRIGWVAVALLNVAIGFRGGYLSAFLSIVSVVLSAAVAWKVTKDAFQSNRLKLRRELARLRGAIEMYEQDIPTEGFCDYDHIET